MQRNFCHLANSLTEQGNGNQIAGYFVTKLVTSNREDFGFVTLSARVFKHLPPANFRPGKQYNFVARLDSTLTGSCPIWRSSDGNKQFQRSG
jgi:hypothetical protein